jgi:hypothetical protein
MKNILSIIAILAIIFTVSSCGNKKKKDTHPAGTHVHEDGTVHSNDAHDHETAQPKQESFDVKDVDAEHNHEGHDHDAEGHEHDHGDGDAHSHDNDAEHKHESGDEHGHDHDHDHPHEHK